MQIKLSNLEAATAQQVFDQVANHLLTQKQVSVSSGEYCAYRGSNNLMCAAGCLIGDDEYTPDMDFFNADTSWSGLINRQLVPETQHTDLIANLQLLHDSDKPKEWEAMLKVFAVHNNLQFNFVSKETV